MSYILDALKKADAERERNAVPGLHAQAAAGADDEARHAGGALTWLAGAALVVLAALAAWWWMGRSTSPEGPVPMAANTPAVVVSPPAQPAAPPIAVPAPVVVPAPATAAAPMPPPTAQPATPPKVYVPPAPAVTPPVAAAPPTTATATAAPASAVDGRIPQLAELSPDLRRQLPPLAVGGSVYSAKPASRMVILNGQVLREGDSVIEGLVVERIGLKSSILSLRGTRFEIKH